MKLNAWCCGSCACRWCLSFETSFSRTYERNIIIVEVVSEGLSGWGEITAGRASFL